MNAAVLEFIKAHTQPKYYQPGEIVFHQGESTDSVYYLEQGCALAYAILPDGKEKNIFLNWSGQTIALGSFIEQVPHRAYLIAVHPCTIYAINRSLMQTCLEQVPSARDAIIENLSRDVAQLFEKLADSALPSTEVRIARFICRRMAKGQCDFRGKFPELNFTQDFIADVVGVSRSAISDALSYFKRSGWISTGYGHITVLAPDALRQFAYGNS